MYLPGNVPFRSGCLGPPGIRCTFCRRLTTKFFTRNNPFPGLRTVRGPHHDSVVNLTSVGKSNDWISKPGSLRASLPNKPLNKVNRLATGKWTCIQQAIYFYGQLQNHLAALKPFGITTEVIAQSLAAAEAVLEMKSDRTRTKGMAEDSTQEKQRAFQALRAWVMDFRRTARLAFQGNPQMLEIFGIRVRSTTKG